MFGYATPFFRCYSLAFLRNDSSDFSTTATTTTRQPLWFFFFFFFSFPTTMTSSLFTNLFFFNPLAEPSLEDERATTTKSNRSSLLLHLLLYRDTRRAERLAYTQTAYTPAGSFELLMRRPPPSARALNENDDVLDGPKNTVTASAAASEASTGDRDDHDRQPQPFFFFPRCKVAVRRRMIHVKLILEKPTTTT